MVVALCLWLFHILYSSQITWHLPKPEKNLSLVCCKLFFVCLVLVDKCRRNGGDLSNCKSELALL